MNYRILSSKKNRSDTYFDSFSKCSERFNVPSLLKRGEALIRRVNMNPLVIQRLRLLDFINKQAEKWTKKVKPIMRVKYKGENRSYLSKKRVIRLLEPLHIVLRFKSGIATLDEIRLFLGNNSKIFSLPATRDQAYECMQWHINNAIVLGNLGGSRLIKNYVNDLFGDNSIQIDFSEFPDHPLFLGIYNQFHFMSQALDMIMEEDYKLDQ